MPIAALAALLVLFAGGPAVAKPLRLKATGASRGYDVRVAGGESVFQFTQIAGCRYRIVAAPGTLQRPVLRMGRAGEEPIVRVDAGVSGKPAVHVYDAERDALMELRVGGFSAQTGKGRVRLETLGPGDKPVKPAHRRFLAPGGERARVGELLVGETNRWELVVEEGVAYQITPTRGSAGRVHLVVHGWNGKPIGDSAQGGAAWVAYPPVRFRVPARTPPDDSDPTGKKAHLAPAGPVTLVVRGIFDGGGTYGVKLRPLGPDQSVNPPKLDPPKPVERGAVEGQPNTFRAGPGDVALLYVPYSPNRSQRVEMLRGTKWISIEDMGRGGSARSGEEHALMVWFQPYYPGTYRFRGWPAPPPSKPQMTLHDRALLGIAPIHMGTGVDPTVRVRLRSKWTLVGLGICMPGWDYIFVCAHAPNRGVAMRVLAPDGKVVRTRSAAGDTIVLGLGPSLRFRVPKPGIYRLQAKNARKRIVRPMLRRASN